MAQCAESIERCNDIYKGIPVKAFGYFFGLGFAALVAGCGGGGGSSGNTALEYKIALRADKTKLPVNISNEIPSIGVSAPYTTTLYITATEGGNPIVGTKDAFACNVDAGLNVGALYYLDGKSEHETVVDGKKIPNAYRNITLDSNSGGATFHFHAGDTVGTARVVCTVTDPRDNQVKTASAEIVVGNSTAPAAGMPASVVFKAESGALGARLNQNNVPNTISVQAQVTDEVGQWVSDTTSPNLQVYIQGGDASAGARLRHDGQTGTVIMTTTRNGVADFALSSGDTVGPIVLVMTADRADNNVANGIQDPVSQVLVIPTWNGIPNTPLTLAAQSIAATCNQRVSYALTVSGGVPPYKWTADKLPAGLELSSAGLVSGVPLSLNGTNAGSYSVPVTVTDSNLHSVSANMTITVAAGACAPLSISDSSVAAIKGKPFVFALSAKGGTSPYKWSVLDDGQTGVTINPDTGVLSGNLSTAGKFTVVVKVTDNDKNSVIANVSITVTDPTATP